MKKAGQWKNRMVLALELPPDLAYNETIVTLTGQTEVAVGNYPVHCFPKVLNSYSYCEYAEFKKTSGCKMNSNIAVLIIIDYDTL